MSTNPNSMVRTTAFFRAILLYGGVFLFSVPMHFVGGASGEPQRIGEFESIDGEIIESQFYAFSSSAEASTLVRQILTYVGLQEAKLEIFATENVSQVVAGFHEGRRLILYNESFMREATRDSPDSDWIRLGVLAHEIGHHLAGHTLVSGDEASGALRRRQELEADQFSGFILRRMGATLEEAQSAVNAFATVLGSTTHPPKERRLAAVKKGWELSGQLDRRVHQNLASRRAPLVESGNSVGGHEPPASLSMGELDQQFHGFGEWSPPSIRYIRQFQFSDRPQMVFYGTNYGEVWAFNRFNGMPMGMVGRWYPTIPDGTPFIEQIVWGDGNIYRIDSNGQIFFVTWGFPRWVGGAVNMP